MELMLFIWAASTVGGIKVILCIILALCAAHACSKVIWALFHADTDYTKAYKPDQYNKAMEIFKFKWMRGIGAVMVILGIIVTVIPTEKTLYMMAAGYGAQAVVQSETADKVLKIVNGKLDEYLNDVEKSVKEGAKR